MFRVLFGLSRLLLDGLCPALFSYPRAGGLGDEIVASVTILQCCQNGTIC